MSSPTSTNLGSTEPVGSIKTRISKDEADLTMKGLSKDEPVSPNALKHKHKNAVAECQACGYTDVTRVEKEGSMLKT